MKIWLDFTSKFQSYSFLSTFLKLFFTIILLHLSDAYYPVSNNYNDLYNFTPTNDQKQVQKRQFSAYICGIPPFRFRSDYPCQFYAICINGGFRTNVPCSDSSFCQQQNPDTLCVQGTCCTMPVIIGASTPLPSIIGTTKSAAAPSHHFSLWRLTGAASIWAIVFFNRIWL